MTSNISDDLMLSRNNKKGLKTLVFKPFFVFFFLLLFFSNEAYSQNNFIDTIQNSLTKKPKPIWDFSSRNAFIGGVKSPVYNIKIGLQYNNQLSIGIGYAFLKPKMNVTGDFMDENSKEKNAAGVLSFGYFNVFANYVYYRANRWQFSIPLLLGIGASKTKYNYLGTIYSEPRKLLLIYEPVISFQYKIVNWLGVGGDVGFRFMHIVSKSIDQHLSSPEYSINVSIYFGELFKTLFPKSKLPQHKYGKYLF